MLENIAYIVKKLEGFKFKNSSINGEIHNLSQKDIDNISPLIDCIEECATLDGVNISDIDDYKSNIGNSIKIQISTGNISGYFDNFSSFINKNKIILNSKDFYIRDMGFLYSRDNTTNTNKQVKKYFNNIKLIVFLGKIADYKKESAGDLELFFYRAERGLVIKINYNKEDLSNLSIGNLAELENHFFEKPDKEERKQIFINSLIDILESDNSYSFLIKEFDNLKDKYEASFRLYLTGFSFEKIATASTAHLQKLTDRIYEQINKATTNIFIVPAAYIFLIRSFELSNNTFQNVLLLATSLIFSLVMHCVLFKNMSENLSAVVKDIDNFKEKLISNDELQKVLNDFKESDIKKQRTKIAILQWCNWILFIFVLSYFCYVQFILCN